jgi:hypothetical protein
LAKQKFHLLWEMDEGQVVVEGELAVRGMREEVPGDQLMQKVVFI